MHIATCLGQLGGVWGEGEGSSGLSVSMGKQMCSSQSTKCSGEWVNHPRAVRSAINHQHCVAWRNGLSFA